MELKIDKKLKNKKLKNGIKWNTPNHVKGIKERFKQGVSPESSKQESTGWNFLFAFVFFVLFFSVLLVSLVKLQIVQGQEMLNRSTQNKIRLTTESAYRGVIFDNKGEKLVENLPSMNVYLSLTEYIGDDNKIDREKLSESLDTLTGILGEKWANTSAGTDKVYSSLYEKIIDIYSQDTYASKILVATDIDNQTAIKIKPRAEQLVGVTVDNGNKRNYTYGTYFAHILGYTGEASFEDVNANENLKSGDIVGKLGIERKYDDLLRGTDGTLAEEIDVLGRAITSSPYLVESSVAGKNLYLSVDKDAQKKLYDLIEESVKKNGATAGAGVIEDVNTGEILAIVSYPSYDSNQFIGGISVQDYNSLLINPSKPLINRAISAQMPPGSTFKTIVATAALDAKEITTSTTYVSRTGYTFSNGAPFQEFRNHSYGVLNVKSALTVSSNIFFCEVIRNWDMNELAKYLEKFGIGQYTGIDIPGEAPGRLPSPENKIKLANTTSPWLEPIWFPEGDSCNSVIGQGITLVTPVQMANWMGAIANNGTLNTPHVVKKSVDAMGMEEYLTFNPLYTNIASSQSLQTTREGMWESVNGARGIAGSLSTTGVVVAAKTGTAEFGKVNEKGIYEHTHAWVGGFFPYEKPKYSFSIFLEDGGMSTNATAIAREMITWMNQSDFLE